MEPILLFSVVFICVSLGSYIREYITLMAQNAQSLKDKKKARKPSARKIFSVGLVGSILLLTMNKLFLKLDDAILLAASIAFGWLGLDFIMFLTKRPETLLASIPTLKALTELYRKYKDDEAKAEASKKNGDVRRENDPK
jgi:hypothetical protein